MEGYDAEAEPGDEGNAFFEDNLKWRVNDGDWEDDYELQLGLEPDGSENKITRFDIEVAQVEDQPLDYLIITVVPQETRTAFDTWYQRERDPGDPDWRDELYDIYTNLSGGTQDPEAGCSLLPPFFNDVWGAPDDIDTLYHAGGYFEMRSQDTDMGAGAQAIYDEAGALIEDGVSAGSADRFSPDSPADIFRHRASDALPFIWAAQMDGNPVEMKNWINEFPFLHPTLTNLIFYHGEHLERYFECRPPVAQGQGRLAPGECQSEE